MILFDLICSSDHQFEGWFPDSKAFERQKRKGQVVCPVCGDTQIEKALMAPTVSTSKRQAAQANKANQAAMLHALRQLRDHVESNCDYVGKDFAEEARKIHYGEVEERGIYGEADRDEAKSLHEEGIDVSVVPWLPHSEN